MDADMEIEVKQCPATEKRGATLYRCIRDEHGDEEICDNRMAPPRVVPAHHFARVTTVHACPPEGSSQAPCCGWSIFVLPRRDRITLDPARVTCRG